jgi:hypothetical protein
MSSEKQEREPVPWLWLGMGMLLTIIACVAAFVILNSFLAQRQAPAAESPEATIIILTAPPSPTTDAAGPLSPPTPMPTFTPIPTPDSAVAPPEITSGFYAVVANTGGAGVTVRGGPNRRNVALLVAEEGTILLVLDGPQEGENFSWWQVQLADGTEGWVAEDFLEPAAAP